MILFLLFFTFRAVRQLAETMVRMPIGIFTHFNPLAPLDEMREFVRNFLALVWALLVFLFFFPTIRSILKEVSW